MHTITSYYVPPGRARRLVREQRRGLRHTVRRQAGHRGGVVTAAALRILHLEDDGSDAALVAAELERASIACEIVRVDNLSDFARELSRGTVHMVLSDFSMPSLNGLAALTLAREPSPDVPFLFISGTIGEERAIEALKLAATDYVLKENL